MPRRHTCFLLKKYNYLTKNVGAVLDLKKLSDRFLCSSNLFCEFLEHTVSIKGAESQRVGLILESRVRAVVVLYFSKNLQDDDRSELNTLMHTSNAVLFTKGMDVWTNDGQSHIHDSLL